MTWLKKKDMKRYMRESSQAMKMPLPTRMLTNGEFNPMPQTNRQAEVEFRLNEMADKYGKMQGLDRREFLKSASGMAAAFVAMNEVFGHMFVVDKAEAADPDVAQARLAGLRGQAIIDTQTHFVHEKYGWDPLNFLRDLAKGNNSKKTPWNAQLLGEKPGLDNYKFENYVKEVFLDSETSVSLVSSFTTDTVANVPLTDEQMVKGRDLVNAVAGTRRMMCHGMFWPGYPGWLDRMDQAIAMGVDSWKGYTVGDPLGPSKYTWMMDNEKLTYPGYEKAMQSGIRNVCVHKGLIPNDYKTSFKSWKYAGINDIVKAAKDFPDLNFIIYHAGMRASWEYDGAEAELNKTGRLPWLTDLAEAISEHGLTNVYPEIGTTFASTVISYPRVTAYLLGTLLKHAGLNHVIWGTDSVWYGSPQWQIEAMRRLEIPEDMRKKYGLAPLGGASGMVKNTIFGPNQARLYDIPLTADGRMPAEFETDGIAKMKADYEAAGPDRSMLALNYIRENVGTV